MATFGQKLRLFRGLLTREVAHTGPVHGVMDLTRRCNMHCLGCRFHGPEVHVPSPGDQRVKDMPFDLARSVIAELGTMGTSSLTLLGEGEPLLYPHLFDVISTSKDAGLYVEVASNGTLLNETNVEQLIECRLDKLKVSMWASSPEEYGQHHHESSPENFHRTVEGTNLLIQRRTEKDSKLPLVVLHEPINRHNFESIHNLAALARSMGCDGVSFTPLFLRRGKLRKDALSQEQEQALRLSLLRLKDRLSEWGMTHNIDQTLSKYDIGEEVWEKLPCYAGWFLTHIKPDGVVLPCSRGEVPMGNLTENSFHEIWGSPAYRTFRRTSSTREGLQSLHEDYDCGFCGDIVNTYSIHQYYKWIAPVASRVNTS